MPKSTPNDGEDHDESRPAVGAEGPERRYLSAEASELRVASTKGTPTHIEGYAAVFNRLSDVLYMRDGRPFRERVARGAFSKVLAANPAVYANVNHEGGLNVVGATKNNTLRLKEDAHGLFYRATPPNTSAGRDILELVDKGYIDKSSFAFRTQEEDGDEWEVREDMLVRTVMIVGELADVAAVDRPAYPDSSVSATALAARSLAAWEKRTGERLDASATPEKAQPTESAADIRKAALMKKRAEA